MAREMSSGTGAPAQTQFDSLLELMRGPSTDAPGPVVRRPKPAPADRLGRHHRPLRSAPGHLISDARQDGIAAPTLTKRPAAQPALPAMTWAPVVAGRCRELPGRASRMRASRSFGGHGMSKVEALAIVTPEGGQLIALLDRFDAFRHDRHAQQVGELDHC